MRQNQHDILIEIEENQKGILPIRLPSEIEHQSSQEPEL